MRVVREFIVGMFDAGDRRVGVSVVSVGRLYEGAAFELGRRPGCMERCGEDGVGVMGAENWLGRGLICDVRGNKDASLPAHDTFVPFSDVEGEAEVLGVGVW